MLLSIKNRKDIPEFTRELLRQKGSAGKIAERKNDRVWVEILQAVFLLIIYLLSEQGGYWEYQYITQIHLCNWQARSFVSLIVLEKQRREFGKTKVDRTQRLREKTDIFARREMKGKWDPHQQFHWQGFYRLGIL